MARTRVRIVSAAVLAVLLTSLSATPTCAQLGPRVAGDDLRVEWSGSEDRRGRAVVSGYVHNRRAGVYAIGVRLLVEALDDAGRVVASTTGYVMGDVPPSSRSYFEVRAPARAASYRVTIGAFEWRGYGAGGG
jgi:hypothetical protein